MGSAECLTHLWRGGCRLAAVHALPPVSSRVPLVCMPWEPHARQTAYSLPSTALALQAELQAETRKRHATKKALADAVASAGAQAAEQEARDRETAAAQKLQSAWRARKLGVLAQARAEDAEVRVHAGGTSSSLGGRQDAAASCGSRLLAGPGVAGPPATWSCRQCLSACWPEGLCCMPAGAAERAQHGGPAGQAAGGAAAGAPAHARLDWQGHAGQRAEQHARSAHPHPHSLPAASRAHAVRPRPPARHRCQRGGRADDVWSLALCGLRGAVHHLLAEFLQLAWLTRRHLRLARFSSPVQPSSPLHMPKGPSFRPPALRRQQARLRDRVAATASHPALSPLSTPPLTARGPALGGTPFLTPRSSFAPSVLTPRGSNLGSPRSVLSRSPRGTATPRGRPTAGAPTPSAVAVLCSGPDAVQAQPACHVGDVVRAGKCGW